RRHTPALRVPATADSSASFPTRRSSDLHVRVERVGVQAFALHIGARPFGGGVLLRGLLRQPVCVQLRGLSVELGAPGLCLGLLRSEEHTSELQSRFDLVCRLLLEKKKTY